MMNRDLMARQMFEDGGTVNEEVSGEARVSSLPYEDRTAIGQFLEKYGPLSNLMRMTGTRYPDPVSEEYDLLTRYGNPKAMVYGGGTAATTGPIPPVSVNSVLGRALAAEGAASADVSPGYGGPPPAAAADTGAPPASETSRSLQRLQEMNRDATRNVIEALRNAASGGTTSIRKFMMENPDAIDSAVGSSPEAEAIIREIIEAAKAADGIPMAMGGEPMAAAMDQMGADPMAGMMGGEPMAGMMGGDPMAAMGAPPPADLGPATTEGIASQIDPQIAQIIQGAAQNFGDPETAENAEQMMNMVRGDQATVEERRMELGEMVGPEDAAQTPESVLTLVQPVLMMASMDTDTGGIGPMAQEAMNVPVTGEMAGGIMSMAGGPPEPEGGVPPVNFNQGGVVLRFDNGGGVSEEDFFLPTPEQLSRERAGDLAMGENIMSGVRLPVAPPLTRQNVQTPAAAAAPPVVSSSQSTKRSTSGAGRPAAGIMTPTSLGAELTARQAIYDRLLGKSEAATKTELQVDALNRAAKAFANFAQPTAPGQSVFSKFAKDLADADIPGGQAKILAANRQGKDARNLAALAASENSLTADRDFRYTLAQDSAKGVQSLLEQTNKFKYDSGMFRSKAAQEIEMEEFKSNLLMAREELKDKRGLYSKTQLKAMQADIDTSLKRLDSDLASGRDAAKAERLLEQLNLKSVYDLGLQDEKFIQEDKTQTNKFNQENKKQLVRYDREEKIQIAREQHALAIQDNQLAADEIERDLKTANEQDKLVLDKRRVDLLEEKNAIQASASKLEAASNMVGNPSKYLPVMLERTQTITAPNGVVKDFTTLDLFTANRLDPSSGRLINSSLVNMYRGKMTWDDATSSYRLTPAGRLPKETELKILLRHQAAGDVDPSVLGAIKARLVTSGNADAANNIKIPTYLDSHAKGLGVTKAALLDNIYAATATGGALKNLGNKVFGTIGYTVAEGTQMGKDTGQMLEGSTLIALLNMHPSGKPPVLFQAKMEKLVPKIAKVGDATAYASKADALVGILRANMEKAKATILLPSTVRATKQKLQAGIYAAQESIKDWSSISKYVKTKQNVESE